MFEQCLEAIGRTAESVPVIIGVEDLQWVDTDSAELLLFLVRNLATRPGMSFIATLRSDFDPPPRTRELLGEIRRTVGVVPLAIPPLSNEDARALLAELAQARGLELADSHVNRIVSLAEGIPFYLEELVLAARDRYAAIPDSLMNAFRARFGALSEPTRAILRATAIAGRHAEIAVVRAAVALPQREFDYALQAAVQAAFVRVVVDAGSDVCVFRHALLHEAIVADLAGEERSRLHERLAGALESLPVHGDPAAWATQIAYHWDSAGRREALGAHMRAGMSAMRIHAYVSADQPLSRAIELWRTDVAALDSNGRAELLRAAGEAAFLCGRTTQAIDQVQAAIAAVDSSAEPLRAGLLFGQLAEYQAFSGATAAARAAVLRASELIPADPPSIERATVLWRAGNHAFTERRHEEAIVVLREALAMARATGERSIEVLALDDLGLSLALTGSLEAGLASLEEANEIDRTHGSGLGPEARFWPASDLSAVLISLSGDLDRAIRVTSDAIAAAQRYGELGRTVAALTLNLVEALYLRGRWDEALKVIADLGPHAASEPPLDVLVNTHLAQILVAQGSTEQAARHLDSARADVRDVHDPWLRITVELVSAEMHVWSMNRGEVRAATSRGRAVAWPSGGGSPEIETELAAAELLWHGARAEADSVEGGRRTTAGERQEAADVADELARASQSLHDGPTAYGDRWRTRLATLTNMAEQEAARARGGDDANAWRSIAEAWRELRIPYPATYATWRQARCLFRLRRRPLAASLLVSAHQDAVSLKAIPLVRQIEELGRRTRTSLTAIDDGSELTRAAKATGLPDHAAPFEAAMAALSDREREVVALVAEGHSNREIADELFITERTAAAHVSSILGKLGASRRTEAAALWLRGRKAAR
jgi:DNA-binding NarL/FixJ family response regulator